jgi:hypothetical protein
LLAGGFGVVLGEGGTDPGRDDPALGLAGVGHGVAHEVHPAALPGRAEDFGDQALNSITAMGPMRTEKAKIVRTSIILRQAVMP